jgi:hypothetical protein
MPSIAAEVNARKVIAMQDAIAVMPPERAADATSYLGLLTWRHNWRSFGLILLLMGGFFPFAEFIQHRFLGGILTTIAWVILTTWCYWRSRVAYKAIQDLKATQPSYWGSIANDLLRAERSCSW